MALIYSHSVTKKAKLIEQALTKYKKAVTLSKTKYSPLSHTKAMNGIRSCHKTIRYLIYTSAVSTHVRRELVITSELYFIAR